MTKRRSKKRKQSKTLQCLITTGIIVTVAVIATGVWLYVSANRSFDGPEAVTVYIPENSTEQAVNDSLKSRLGDFGVTVARLWSLRGGSPLKAAGVYNVSRGDRAWSIAGNIKNGRSSAIRVTFNNVRLISDLADRIATNFQWSADDFLQACDSVLGPIGYKREEYPAAFMPDTYEFYASATPAKVVSTLADHRNKFWNEERLAKAHRLGLTPTQVATLASIVEEESRNTSEQGTIARLYLNRLDKGMKLQADPTVKFATGDFALRRIYDKHTAIESPYNTYIIKGLPPGPIRIAEAASIDRVLNAPANNFLYMCAKPGGAQEHNFTDSYAQHLANARAYRQWLDSKDIK